MSKPETFSFEGEQRTVYQVQDLLRERRIILNESTIRNRLRRGQTTVREMAKPIATVNRAWNKYEARK